MIKNKSYHGNHTPKCDLQDNLAESLSPGARGSRSTPRSPCEHCFQERNVA